LERARLLVSLGEYEKALESLAAIFTGNYAKDLLLEARFLIAQLEAFRSGNLRPLAALVDDADFSEYGRLIYYTQSAFSPNAVMDTFPWQGKS